MKQLLYFAGQLHRYAGKILYVNLFGMLLIGLLDGAAVLLLLPLIGIIGIIPSATATIPGIGFLSFLQEMPVTWSLTIILCFYIALVAAQSLLQRNLSLREVRIHTGFINHVRLETYRLLLQANWTFFVRKRKSDLINALTGELGRVTNGAFLFLQMIASVAFTLIQIGLALWLSWPLTLFILGCGLLIGWLSRRYIRKSKQLGAVSVDLAQSYLAGISDHFNGMKEIKSNSLEQSRYRWLQDWSAKIERERYEFTKVRNNSQLFYKWASAVMIAVFIFAAVTLFDTQGGQMLLITLLFARLWPRFTGIQSNLEQLASSIPAFRALMELQLECKAERERGGLLTGAFEEKLLPLPMNEALELRDIFFRYDRSSPDYTLHDVNLRIPVNGMTAIVGKSGAGKSTIVDMLLGLIEPERGIVAVDGKPLQPEGVMRLRRSISYVPQDSFLYHASIRDNLLSIDPDATEKEMWEAMEFSSAIEFVRELPQGLDTIIGDRGVLLSGGERQRLVLARAILRKPSILILDEATSALDSLNESKIQQALERLRGKLTMIVIAHRYTTIQDADHVIVVDDGRIVQAGEFQTLAEEQGGMFRSLLGSKQPVAM
ncbi:ABC transporter ATP-binding protein [Paenibacillus sp. NPDC057967]|uniref:ABC transporter ATP-binding protein n=1 Tax=Paenibacillus sp. NPDC057967 TaxID=3346293 RepID=UPI0036DEB74A